MGLRGPDAERARQSAKSSSRRPPKLPWEKPGQTRKQRVIAFLEYLPITKGKLAGRKMKLLPGQRRFVEEVYGRPDARRVRIAVKSEPRGNGKSGLVAGLALSALLGPESEVRGEVYAAAVDRVQSAKLFDELVAIIRKVKSFKARTNVIRHLKRIEVLSGAGEGSVFEALSADARKGVGLAPSLWIFDELAQVETRELLDNLATGMGKRRRALGIVISTQAPDDDHPLSRLIDDGLSGIDPGLFVDLLAAPIDANPFDIETIRSVNPALGIFLDEGDLLSEAERARRLPAFEPAWRNHRLNQRVDAQEEQRIVSPTIWKGLGEMPVDRAKLRGRKCFGALDLSGKHDLTSLTLVFPDDQAEPVFDILPFFWTPEGQLAERVPAERERFKEWIRAGHMVAVPGPTIRFGFIARELVTLSKEFEITVLGYDPWRIDDFKADLDDIAPDFPVPFEKFAQDFRTMGPAVEWFAELALTGRIRHGNHPVLTAAVAGAILITQPGGDMSKIDKGRANKRGPVRVDGAVTLAMALELARRAPVPQVSFWESRAVT